MKTLKSKIIVSVPGFNNLKIRYWKFCNATKIRDLSNFYFKLMKFDIIWNMNNIEHELWTDVWNELNN